MIIAFFKVFKRMIVIYKVYLQIKVVSQPFDIVVMDIKMPGMNGYQLAEAGTALRPNLKVVLMTGYTQDPVPRKMQEAGVRVLYKPFDIDRLPALVSEVLKTPE